ncbi:hypothetical protein BJV82DRAFT_628021 [Fennellomyces sp. T-0311]|nr:hypothetical protein BJV82DRAFT_628021 [Fennellomyces sp. T-0311]
MVAEFTESQIKVLAAVADTIVPPLTEQEESVIAESHPVTAIRVADVSNYTKYSGSSDISRIVANISGFPPDAKNSIQGILDTLSTADGAFELTGHRKEFTSLTRAERENVLLSWKSSASPPLVGLYRLFTSAFLGTIYNNVNCPAYPAMGYEGLDSIRSKPDYQATNPTEHLPMLSFKELSQIQRFDAIVVGSGSGGGVCAAELAAAGQSLLVIEKGAYYHETEFKLNEEEGNSRLLDTGGPIMSEDGSMVTSAASTLGGGTTVNYAASFKPPHDVREKWGKTYGLSYFVSPQFAIDLERVYKRIGATTEGIKHNKANQLLISGCQKLGYDVHDVPKNTSGRAHECSWCPYGCRDAVKNSTTNTWLRDAHEKHNAKFLDRSQVTRVLIQDGKAIGVECIVHGENKANIYADRVVVSAGPLRTPGLLINSGLTNENIGRHLRVHPGTVAYGIFDEPIDPHKGSIVTAVGYCTDRIKIMVPPGHAGAFYSVLPWRGGVKHKQLVLKHRYILPVMVIMSEKESSGHVISKPNGEVTFNYSISKVDGDSLQQSLDDAIQILCAAGAREIHTAQLGINPFVFSKDEEIRNDNSRFTSWREEVKQYGLPGHGVTGNYGPHPMSTCRFGVSPESGVTKPSGETWEVKNLYVADASLFPSSTGTNPMVTTEAVAIHVASNIIDDIKLRSL